MSNGFKKMYKEASVWKDLDNAIATLSNDEVSVLRDALQVVKNFTDLDMRQDFLLANLNYAIGFRKRAADANNE